jgi:predicted nucleic-acid-binding protein
MIGLDTNILVRLFVDDNAAQAAAARRFVTRRCTNDNPGFVNRITLCEMVWVLTRVHGYNRDQTVSVIEELLASRDVTVEDSDAVRAALDLFATRGIDFADALIAVINLAHGCEVTATFDRKAARLDGFVRVR